MKRGTPLYALPGVQRFAALTRQPGGGLAVQTFATGAQAHTAALASGRDWEPISLGSPAELSKRLGGVPSAATIARLCKADRLPHRDDSGGDKRARYRLPIRAILASVRNGGLRATIARHQAGLFSVR